MLRTTYAKQECVVPRATTYVCPVMLSSLHAYLNLLNTDLIL